MNNIPSISLGTETVIISVIEIDGKAALGFSPSDQVHKVGQQLPKREGATTLEEAGIQFLITASNPESLQVLIDMAQAAQKLFK